MAFTELVFPCVKPDPATLETLERDWPKLSKGLTDPNPGLLSAFRGWVLTEDGLDVRKDYKEFLLLEWNSADSFNAFVGSEQYAAFAGSIKHLLTGPPTLQFFETKLSPKDAASASMVEIIRVTLPNSEDVEEGLQVWEKACRHLASNGESTASVTYGKSKNLDKDVVVGIIGWQTSKEQQDMSQDEVWSGTLESLKSLGKVSQIIVDIDVMDL
ncbi:uncharacterized protein N7503_006845 [Penicillium pulvis]|uniref:uncharacterized protein n=1 Tax=Penicillium pulvis TaxID=1562058 RepID=UPI0025486944|nr:uncharacterized protein N7503_006845 [Penicillium pulvis]KAJ5797549.1 hypothetical protein N7503_006845 [Penicillium pulvis]